jgi:hypothetical protein
LNWTPAAAGTYQVGVWARQQGTSGSNGAYDAATSLVRTVTAPVQLTSGVTVSNQSVALNQITYYYIAVPAGMSQLTVAITGVGDADLYTRFGSHPTLGTFDCRPYLSIGNESCVHQSPAAGTWWIAVHGYAAATYSITATLVQGRTNSPCSDGQFRIEYFRNKDFSNSGAVECQNYQGVGVWINGGSWVWSNGTGPSQLGGQSGRYSIRMRGWFFFATGGTYHCHTNSDDGSALFIDGALIVDNRGDHSLQRRDGELVMTAGWHLLQLDFQQEGGDAQVSADCNFVSSAVPSPKKP